jgi:hypothetical protein
MLSIKKTAISINRGDTAFITVTVRDANQQEYTLQEGDQLWFAVKKKATDTDYAIAPKKLQGNVLTIDHSDTIQLDFGTYVYDIQLINSKGYISTIIQPSDFNILQSVTSAGDRANT